MIQNSLSFKWNLRHDFTSIQRVFTICSFSWEHHTVRSIKNCVSYIWSFCSSWSWAVDHWFHHLCGGDHRFCVEICEIDHPFLGDEDFLYWNFHTHVASSNHNSVGFFNDFGIVQESFLVFDLSDDLDSFYSGAKNVSDMSNIFYFTNKACCNHVYSIWNSKFKNVLFVLLS